jgi:hypothetical protein
MKVKVYFLSLFFFLMTFYVQAKELNLSVDKKVLVEGDTLTLTLEYDGDSNNQPDLSKLSKDFNIVSTSTSQQFSFVNGAASQIKKWSFGLRPLHKGKINIPAIKLDNLYSNSVDIEVKEMTDVAYVPDSRENTNAPYFEIKQEFDVKHPYVQQQVNFFVHIYDSIGLQNGAPTISADVQKDWIIVPLTDKPIVRQETINHKRMNIETYAFAAFPQKGGTLEVPQVSFEGFYVKDATFDFPNFDDDISFFGVNFHNVFGQQVPVRMKTKAQTIDVRPIPANSLSASWMPLNNLELSAKWDEKSKFKTDEAITRTITLKATGMTESMLPKITFPEADGFKQYPENPTVSEQIINGKIVTTAIFNNVYIPQKSGRLTIPPLKMQWFNVDTQKLQITSIPQEVIDILPSEKELVAKQNVYSKDTEPLDNKENNPLSPDTHDHSDLAQDLTSLKSSLANLGIAEKAITPLLFLLGILVFIAIISLKQCRKNKLRNEIIRAIKKHDYKRAKENLLIWAQHKFGQMSIQNFNDVSKCVQNTDFSEQLSLLNKILYSNSEDLFDGVKFIEILKKIDKLKCKQAEKNNAVLPNLYD